MNFVFDPSLVLYLPLHEMAGSSFMSRDAYGHLCTVTGALWRPNGHYFDGSDDYISCGNPAALKLAGGMAVLAWVNLTATDTGRILIKGDGDAASTFSYLLDNSSTAGFRFYTSNGTAVIGSSRGSVETANIGVWRLVTGIYDASARMQYLYVDAELIDSDAQTIGLTDVNKNVYIGADEDGLKSIKAVIGDVLVYNRALNPLEIQQIYLATKWRYQ